MRIIDCRGYLGHWPYWEVPHVDETGDGLLGLMDRHGVDASVVVAMRAALYSPQEGNELVFTAAGKHPDRFIPAVVVNPKAHRDPGAYLGECVQRGARAMALFPFYHGYNLRPSTPPLADLLREAGRQDCPVIVPMRLLMNWGFPVVPAADLAATVEASPSTRFVIGGFNYGELPALLDLAGRNSNVWLETSGLTMYRGVETLAVNLGAGRVLMGTAMPLQYPAPGLLKIERADLDREAKERILGGNARRFFLKPARGGEDSDR